MKRNRSHAECNELSHELAGIPALGAEKLREWWWTLYGTEPPPRISEDLLRRAIAYRLQERALGGLKLSTRRLLQRVAEDARRSRSPIASAQNHTGRARPPSPIIPTAETSLDNCAPRACGALAIAEVLRKQAPRQSA